MVLQGLLKALQTRAVGPPTGGMDNDGSLAELAFEGHKADVATTSDVEHALQDWAIGVADSYEALQYFLARQELPLGGPPSSFSGSSENLFNFADAEAHGLELVAAARLALKHVLLLTLLL